MSRGVVEDEVIQNGIRCTNSVGGRNELKDCGSMSVAMKCMEREVMSDWCYLQSTVDKVTAESDAVLVAPATMTGICTERPVPTPYRIW